MKTSSFKWLTGGVLTCVLALKIFTLAYNQLDSSLVETKEPQKEIRSPSAVIMLGVGPFCNRMIVEQLRKK